VWDIWLFYYCFLCLYAYRLYHCIMLPVIVVIVNFYLRWIYEYEWLNPTWAVSACRLLPPTITICYYYFYCAREGRRLSWLKLLATHHPWAIVHPGTNLAWCSVTVLLRDYSVTAKSHHHLIHCYSTVRLVGLLASSRTVLVRLGQIQLNKKYGHTATAVCECWTRWCLLRKMWSSTSPSLL